MIKKKLKSATPCFCCGGTGRHFGGECGACYSTGMDKVRKLLQYQYNVFHRLPLNDNIIV